jgi:hypothetical protein
VSWLQVGFMATVDRTAQDVKLATDLTSILLSGDCFTSSGCHDCSTHALLSIGDRISVWGVVVLFVTPVIPVTLSPGFDHPRMDLQMETSRSPTFQEGHS